MTDLTIRVGGRYRTRGGAEAEVLSRARYPAFSLWPYKGTAMGIRLGWNEDGSFQAPGVHHELDLVSEITEPTAPTSAHPDPALAERIRSGCPDTVGDEFFAMTVESEAPASGLTIAVLQRAHVERQEEWCPDQKPDLSFRGNEMAGEVGEACNVIKKLERERHGWRGSRDTVDHLGEELADVVHTAVLCAITAGIELAPYVVAKFNDTSRKNGLSTMLDAGGEA